MAKTVFGMPGVGKQKTGGGDAVAPEGSPGAKPGGSGGLPQKSGKEQPRSPLKPAQPQGAASEPEKKPSVPPLAKPSSPPQAASPPGAKGPPAGGKTMFGMPAIKLPGQPGGPPAPGDSTQPIGAAHLATGPAAPNAPAASTEEDDAFKATVLGMAAPDINLGAEPVVQTSSPLAGQEETPGLAASPAMQPMANNDFSAAPDIGEETSSVRIGAGNAGGGLPKWAVAAIVVAVAAALFLVGFFLLGDPSKPEPEAKPAASGAATTP